MLLYACFMFSPKTWWKFAINSTVHFVKEKNKRVTKTYMIQRAKDIVLYKEAYMQQLRLGACYVDSRFKVTSSVLC